VAIALLGGLSIPQGRSIQIFTDNQITQPSLSRGNRKAETPTFRQKWEITMRKTILTVVSASVIAALTAQAAAAASEHHRTRTNGHAVATQQFRNSNAYAAPSNFAVQPGWSGYDGAMGSGTAGH
jgi:hypothetical protein